jgi:hypothetical protein
VHVFFGIEAVVSFDGGDARAVADEAAVDCGFGEGWGLINKIKVSYCGFLRFDLTSATDK